MVWHVSNWFRLVICRMPFSVRYGLSQVIAAVVYYPLARMSRILEKAANINVENIPLSAYREKSFYNMRTCALDRFGTRLEKRFTAQQIQDMMERTGLRQITFSQSGPYWCAVGRKLAEQGCDRPARLRIVPIDHHEPKVTDFAEQAGMVRLPPLATVEIAKLNQHGSSSGYRLRSAYPW
jgi:hypothetical protein